MNRIQELLNSGRISNVTIGISALPGKGLFCSMRSTVLEGHIQGRGLTVGEAIADTERRLPPAPVAAFKMPEVVPILRMPL